MLRRWLKHSTRNMGPSIAASAVPSSSRVRMLKIGLSVVEDALQHRRAVVAVGRGLIRAKSLASRASGVASSW